MSLSAQDIVALARAGFNAEQIGAINAESTVSTPESTVSTESTESTEATRPTAKTEEPTVSTVSPEPTDKLEESTVSTIPVGMRKQAAPAPDPAIQAAAAQDQAPTMQDLMAKLAAMENRMQGAAIQLDQQPGQQGPLTGQDVLARILDPTIE